MLRLSVLLTAYPMLLPEKSMALQRFFVKNKLEFVINFQKGSHAQFFVVTKHCAKHFKSALCKLGFNVEVSEESQKEQYTTREECHECHVAM